MKITRQEIEEIKPIEAFNDFFPSSMVSLLRLANPRCVKMDDGDGGWPPWWLGTSLGWFSSSRTHSSIGAERYGPRNIDDLHCDGLPLRYRCESQSGFGSGLHCFAPLSCRCVEIDSGLS
ncbi:hypothetical protein Q3G72_000858 [Acer saccharum]|nr:hypothetical protein Q3G72_000858 [Acer saccharum]